MKLIALDTATEACSAALLIDGEVAERYQLAPQEHNRLILPMIDGLLADADLTLTDLDAVAFGRGPGSFTGVRIAAAVAQAIAFSADLPVAPVSTLAAMALEAMEETGCKYALPCIDARMGEVYWAVYRKVAEDEVEPLVAESVTAPDLVDVPEALSGVAIGSGWGTYEQCLRARLHPHAVHQLLAERLPRAANVARLGAVLVAAGATVTPENAQPVYLRDNVAKKPAAAR